MAGAISLVGATTSAFAYDGWADSIATAYSLNGPLSGVSTTINASDDVDWYSWTNDTGSNASWNATLQSPAGLNYDMHMVLRTGTQYLSLGSAGDQGPGGLDWPGGTIQAGDTIYFQIRGQKGSDWSTSALYTFNINHP
ncbi:hypothetical protein LOZ80_35345 [Paenibacillus sp. HWE-109]|uniref:hypothetical protein n=1 Tax=Paenibacillus sp. HWE-109 TaxID=1306526 RepID=UPI001EE0B965|nr:hypothetical protein [Paenibacillus sp. HWE-109]UKS26714.1 hypothetical protein LOZ80_35345 [Paenibacillus sp. HWE-109]